MKEEGIVTREELLALGCEEEVRRKGATFYMKDSEVTARNCTKCKRITLREYMTRHAGKYGGLGRLCLECNKEAPKLWKEGNKDRVAETTKKYRENNKVHISEVSREYRENNRERIALKNRRLYLVNKEYRREYERMWSKANPKMRLVRQQRRRARISALPDDLTAEQLAEINASFHYTCALSGEPTDLHVDHVLPISIGHGGTTLGNMIPLSAELNLSKHIAHLYEWFDTNHVRFGLSREKFDALIEYLAEANEMTTQEYRKYTDWCFDNPCVIDETTGELVFKKDADNERKAIA